MEGLDYIKAVEHLSKDKKFKPYIDKIQLPPRNPASDVYSGLISSIIGQQLSVKAAATIHARFLNLFESSYPDSEILLSLNDQTLRSVGLSGQKSKYVRNVATFFNVGKWTVQMILMFVLKRQDVFPVLDLGIQHGMIEIYKLKEVKKELHKRMEKLSIKWKPYRTVACLYLWAIKDVKID